MSWGKYGVSKKSRVRKVPRTSFLGGLAGLVAMKVRKKKGEVRRGLSYTGAWDRKVTSCRKSEEAVNKGAYEIVSWSYALACVDNTKIGQNEDLIGTERSPRNRRR